MGRRSRAKTSVFDSGNEPAWSRIRLLGLKLRAMGHLIGTQAVDEDPPLDLMEVQWGSGMILDDIAAEISEASKKMEKEEIKARGLRKKL